jgi:hypothetical protein
MNQRVLLGALTGDAAAVPALAAELLAALCDESSALRSGDAARIAAAEERKRHLLRLLARSSAPPERCARPVAPPLPTRT